MAAIDKIYGSRKQYREFKNWIQENKPEFLRCIYGGYDSDYYHPNAHRPITNTGCFEDAWFLKYCPIEFVLRSLKEKYSPNFPEIDPDTPIDKLLLEIEKKCAEIINFGKIEIDWIDNGDLKEYSLWYIKIMLKEEDDGWVDEPFGASGHTLQEAMWELCFDIRMKEESC